MPPAKIVLSPVTIEVRLSYWKVSLVPMFDQSTPKLLDRNTPVVEVAAKRLVSREAKASTEAPYVGRSLFTATHVLPLSIERNTPPFVPAKRSLPIVARQYTFLFMRPRSTG